MTTTFEFTRGKVYLMGYDPYVLSRDQIDHLHRAFAASEIQVIFLSMEGDLNGLRVFGTEALPQPVIDGLIAKLLA